MILENLKKFIDFKRISIAAFEKSIGMSNNSFRKSLNTGGNLGSDKLENILKIYPEINPAWILTGCGDMLISTNSPEKNVDVNVDANVDVSSKSKEIYSAKASNKSTQNSYLSPESEEGNTCNIAAESEAPYLSRRKSHEEIALPGILDNESPLSIPFYDLPVSAGSLGILDLDTCTTTSPSGYIQMPVFRGCEAIFPIMGISMEPVVHSGDWIGIKSIDNLSRSWDFVQTGVIYLIITREDRMIKYIEKADDSDYIVCSSPNYNPFKVYKGDILNIYRVKAVAKGL